MGSIGAAIVGAIGLGTGPSAPKPPARINSASPGVKVGREGAWNDATPGMEIGDHDFVKIRKGESVAVTDRDGTVKELVGGSVVPDRFLQTSDSDTSGSMIVVSKAVQ